MPNLPDPIEKAFSSALRGEGLPAAHALALLPFMESHILDLMAAAGAAAAKAGRRLFTCGIVNAKAGRCSEDCAFCAQSASCSSGVAAHPLLGTERIMEHARRFAAAGVEYLGLVASGAGPTPAEFAAVIEAGERVRREGGPKLCASLGIISMEQARALRRAGFASYHHNLETAASFFPSVCTSHSYEERAETVRRAKAAGLRVCSGGLFGLGESWEQRVELAETLAGLEADSIPVNFLSPIPGTPLAARPVMRPREALAIIALLRLMLPRRDIIVCGGRPAALGEFDRLVFSAGANGLITGDYLTTAGRDRARDAELLRQVDRRMPC